MNGKHKGNEAARYWVTIANSEGTREGQLVVLADHSTDGQGVSVDR
jgi:hypothetical protein